MATRRPLDRLRFLELFNDKIALPCDDGPLQFDLCHVRFRLIVGSFATGWSCSVADAMEPRSKRMNSMRMLNALLLAATLVACAHQAWAQQHLHSAPAVVAQAPQTPAPPQTSASPPAAVAHGDTHAPTIFTLRSGIAQGRMVYLGVGGDIDGKVNPMLVVHEGETVQINLINGEGAEHDIVIDQYAARSDRVLAIGASSTLAFTADKTGEFIYFCSIAGHREAGMEGRIQVTPGARATVAAIAPEIVRDPTDLPSPIRARPPQVVRVDLETVELKGQLDDKTTYNFWTFNGKVPGPFVRVRVGDTVEVHL